MHRNYFVGFLEMILPFVIVFALRWTYLLSRNASVRAGTFLKLISRTELVSVVFWLFLAIVILAALILSRSRMGIISALVSLVAILALAGTSTVGPRARAAVAAVFFLGVLGLVVWIGSDPVMSRFETLGQEYNLSGQSRVSIWHDTLGLIRQHPFLGTGLGSFFVAYTSRSEEHTSELQSPDH